MLEYVGLAIMRKIYLQKFTFVCNANSYIVFVKIYSRFFFFFLNNYQALF